MRGLKFDIKALSGLHNQHKSVEDATKADMKQQQIAFILQATRSLDVSACQRAYEEVFLKTGSFNTISPPKVCYTEELHVPSCGYGYDHHNLKTALQNEHKGLALTSCSMYDDGPRIVVEPEYFEFDMATLNAKRAEIVAMQKKNEIVAINKVVPELVASVMVIDLPKCFDAYCRAFTTSGRFPESLPECSTKEVKLDTLVSNDDLSATFYRVVPNYNTDNRTVGISAWRVNGTQYARAYVTSKMFQ
jgi:hypothetical protein